MGDEVIFELDEINPEDEKAVVIITTQSAYKLGYVPAFYNGFMHDVIKNSGTYKAKVEGVHIDANPQQKVNISFVGESDITEYQGAEFDIMERVEIV